MKVLSQVFQWSSPPRRLRESDARFIRLQLAVSQLLILFTYLAVAAWMKIFRRYRIEDLAKLRKLYREGFESGDGPVIVCANHLTLIDSFLLIWALSSLPDCLRTSSRFPWNLPERRNFYGHWGMRTLCFLGKCVPVLRGGPREEARRLLDKVAYLLSIGETLMIFPEGGRSRTGRIDVENFAYGVGTMIQEAPAGTRVLCVYLRGQHQADYGDLPVKGERFRAALKWIRPSSESSGLRGAREISTQIIHNLVELEAAYFAANGPAAPSAPARN